MRSASTKLQPQDCGENNRVLLYGASQGVVYGKVYQSGRSTLLGNPPPVVAGELDKLWQKEWRGKPRGSG